MNNELQGHNGPEFNNVPQLEKTGTNQKIYKLTKTQSHRNTSNIEGRFNRRGKRTKSWGNFCRADSFATF